MNYNSPSAVHERKLISLTYTIQGCDVHCRRWAMLMFVYNKKNGGGIPLEHGEKLQINIERTHLLNYH